jgi:uncharacterized protein involved in outer membrane biogenesis
VAIDHLVLSDGRKVERIRTRFSLADGKLDAPQVQAAGYGGTIGGSISIDARAKPPGGCGEARTPRAGSFRAARGGGRQPEVKGGKTTVGIDLAMRGQFTAPSG